MINIGILLFPDVEELDFVGPYETISYINKLHPNSAIVELVAKDLKPVRAYNGLRVLPDAVISTEKCYDVLVIPGGQGRHQAMFDPEIINYVKRHAAHNAMLCSVCTGAFILGEAGLLVDLEATTHYTAIDELRQRYPRTCVVKKRVVQNGRIWLAAGISSGIDLSLQLISHLFSPEDSVLIAERLEYRPHEQ